MAFLRTHKHNTEVTILGTTFARVIEIINGYTLEFEDGAYTVKLVGSNNNLFDSAVLVRNQVQVVSTNSAGLIASATDTQISQSVNFKDGVYLDVSSSVTGTAYPNGTRTHPVNNLTDALALCGIWSSSTINLAGTLTLDQSVSGKEIISWKNGKVDLNGQMVIATRFKNLEVYGTQSYIGLFYNCRVKNLQGLNGVYEDCSFMYSGALTVLASGAVSLLNCTSNISGGHTVIFDCDNDNIELELRNVSMGLKLINYKHADNLAELGFLSGMLELDPTCTAGNIYVGGICGLVDNSGAGCNVNVDGLAATSIAGGGLTTDEHNKLMKTLEQNKFIALK